MATLQKQEETLSIVAHQKTQVDYNKEDGVRKESYKNERAAQENWEKKWGFLKNPRRLWEKEAQKRGLPADVFDKGRKNKVLPEPRVSSPNVQISPLKKFPTLSSGMIGWMSSEYEKNLDRLAGPLYVSPKRTMDLFSHSDELNLNQQKFIFLG